MPQRRIKKEPVESDPFLEIRSDLDGIDGASPVAADASAAQPLRMPDAPGAGQTLTNRRTI